MMSRSEWKWFVCELLAYAVLVLVYFALVLHFMGGWLKELFDDNSKLYAVVALALMIGQAVGLEMISGVLIRFMRRERK